MYFVYMFQAFGLILKTEFGPRSEIRPKNRCKTKLNLNSEQSGRSATRNVELLVFSSNL